jgi:hypothetical protein
MVQVWFGEMGKTNLINFLRETLRQLIERLSRKTNTWRKLYRTCTSNCTNYLKLKNKSSKEEKDLNLLWIMIRLNLKTSTLKVSICQKNFLKTQCRNWIPIYKNSNRLWRSIKWYLKKFKIKRFNVLTMLKIFLVITKKSSKVKTSW